jgi:hypothetical protein
MIVRCIRECWYAKRARHYLPGDQDDIDPRDPVAKYFTGFPPGTEVYFKESADKKANKKIVQGFRKVPGEVIEPAEDADLKSLREAAKAYPSIKYANRMTKEDLISAINKASALAEIEAGTDGGADG